jgi:hypothetical protein
VLKLKDELARDLMFAIEESRAWPAGAPAEHQERVGVDYVASTRNIADHWVVEVKWTPAGVTGLPALDAPSQHLWHSLKPNRIFGVAHWDGDTVVVQGGAGHALALFLTGKPVGVAPADSPDLWMTTLQVRDRSTGALGSVVAAPVSPDN